jgi:hypothetical protein
MKRSRGQALGAINSIIMKIISYNIRGLGGLVG